jgi:hypothetical protein
LHCPDCGKRLPKGDNTICPHCGFSLLTSKQENYNPTDAELEGIRKNESNAVRKRKFKLPFFAYLAIVGAVLTLLGFWLILFYPYPTSPNEVPPQPYEDLVVGGLASGISGMVILLVSCFGLILPLRRKMERGEYQNPWLLDVMEYAPWMPEWWRWWMGWIPFVFVEIILNVLLNLSASVNVIVFFVYFGVWVLLDFFVARRWIKKTGQQDKTDGGLHAREQKIQ